MAKKYKPNIAIKKLRQKMGITQRELGEMVGLSSSVIGFYEVGSSRAPLRVREFLSRNFGGEEIDYRQIPLDKRPLRRDVRFSEKINYRLRDVIYKYGLTPAEICSIRGVRSNALALYIRGDLPVGKKIADKLASVIGCSVEDLRGEEWKRYLEENPDSYSVDVMSGDNMDQVSELGKIREDRSSSLDVCGDVRDAMKYLSPEERNLLEERYGFFSNPRTLVDIAGSEKTIKATIWERQRVAEKHLRNILARKEFGYQPITPTDELDG